jgi:hypothetical protein
LMMWKAQGHNGLSYVKVSTFDIVNTRLTEAFLPLYFPYFAK